MGKLKLNFATRVRAGASGRGESQVGNPQERLKLQSEINSRPVRIDRSVFKKSDVERVELSTAKARWKKLNA